MSTPLSNFPGRIAMNLCPPFKDYISHTYTLDTCRFLSGLPRDQNSIHSDCTPDRCRGEIPESKCKPRHVTDHDCNFGKPQMDRIENLIRSEKIPLLSFESTANGDLEIAVVEAKFDSRYIAVSHVWTGGLGNPRANELPQCQLKIIKNSGKQICEVIKGSRVPHPVNLFRDLRSIFVSGDIKLFWVDTLCIPVKVWEVDRQRKKVETEGSRKMREMAIDRMTQTYAGAHSVLIIDPVLRFLPNDMLNNRDDREKLFGTIVLSDWMHRCWTYQEGAMGGRLFVLLEKGPVYLTWERFKISKNPHASELEKDLTKWLELPTPPRIQNQNPERPIIGIDPRILAEVWNNLLSRSTTHPRDRYLILALMLNLVPGKLLRIRDDPKRMRTIFNSLHRIPLDLIYERDASAESYWLPTEMGGQLSVSDQAQLERTSFEEDFLTLKFQESGTSRIAMPSLYILTNSELGRSRGYFRIADGYGERYFRLVTFTMERSWPRYSSFVLLIKDTRRPILQPHEAHRRAVVFGVVDSDDANMTIERLCGYKCTVEQYPSPPQPTVSLSDDQLVSGTSFRIRCHFGDDIDRLDIHRDPSLPLNPGQKVIVPVHMHLDAHLGVFFTVYIALVAIIACTPNNASFSPVWLVAIIWIAFGQMVFNLHQSIFSDSRTGEKVMHARWLNSLTPDAPDALPRNVKVLKRVNYGPTQTLFRIAFGTAFTALGIAYRDNRDCRVMTVLGVMWLLELGVRWLTELAYNHYWEVNPIGLHPLAKEFLQESRLTRWCMRWLGWPRPVASEAPGQVQQRREYYNDW